MNEMVKFLRELIDVRVLVKSFPYLCYGVPQTNEKEDKQLVTGIQKGLILIIIMIVGNRGYTLSDDNLLLGTMVPTVLSGLALFVVISFILYMFSGSIRNAVF